MLPLRSTPRDHAGARARAPIVRAIVAAHRGGLPRREWSWALWAPSHKALRDLTHPKVIPVEPAGPPPTLSMYVLPPGWQKRPRAAEVVEGVGDVGLGAKIFAARFARGLGLEVIFSGRASRAVWLGLGWLHHVEFGAPTTLNSGARFARGLQLEVV